MYKEITAVIDFFKVWIFDALFYPIKWVKNRALKSKIPTTQRADIESSVIHVCVHEWGGYPIVRSKKIKNIPQFECGLKYQIDRFAKYRKQNKVRLTVTISDPFLHENLNWIQCNSDQVLTVPNLGMDFSGYAHFYESIKNLPNSYVILTNSSVNSLQEDFLDSFIQYMNENRDVGLLGVSCSSKYYHTFIRNNYNPHIQSFFILTTISVLKEIVNRNNHKFPGTGIVNKHLLIRNGEVLISRRALELGYNLSIVYNHQVVKFNYRHYPFPKTDLRQSSIHPNAITKLIN